MREVRIAVANSTRASSYDRETNEDILARAKKHIALAGRTRPDLILLSELFANHAREATREAVATHAQAVPGPVSEEMAALAQEYQTYIAFGLLRRAGNKVFNSMVLLNREGKQVWTYDKMQPMAEEMDLGISPGRKVTVHRTEFGTIGGVICFDINFLELAEHYARLNTELILFCSAFPAGRLMDIWAIRYGVAVAGSTWYPQNRILDCTGSTVARTSDILPTMTAVLNLNRRVVHMDGNLAKIDKMVDKYRGDVLIEDLRQEACCVITSLKKGLEVADLMEEFKIEPLFAYFDRVRRVREKHGGLAFPTWG